MLTHVCARPHYVGYTDHNTNLMGATWSMRKMMLTHVCARPHYVGYTDHNTNLMGETLECEKNDVNTRLCQATLQASHTPMLQALSSCHNGVQLSVQHRGGLAATVPRIDKN